jgi:hypothetical protein
MLWHYADFKLYKWVWFIFHLNKPICWEPVADSIVAWKTMVRWYLILIISGTDSSNWKRTQLKQFVLRVRIYRFVLQKLLLFCTSLEWVDWIGLLLRHWYGLWCCQQFRPACELTMFCTPSLTFILCIWPNALIKEVTTSNLFSIYTILNVQPFIFTFYT